MAGESISDALDHGATLNEHGITAIFNLLGSHNDELSTANADAATYRALIEDIGSAGLDAAVSIKPSQIGLDIGVRTFRSHLTQIVEFARDNGVFVWLDMEEPETIDPTIDAYEEIAHAHDGGIGVCIQANMKRTDRDIERLSESAGKIRFVKGGAYDVSPLIAYTERERIDRVYRELLESAFETFDDGIAVASHDPEMIEFAKSLHHEHGTPFEIQMLMGIRSDEQKQLASEYDVSQYVPFGEHWPRWVLNRTKNHAPFIAKNLMHRFLRGSA